MASHARPVHFDRTHFDDVVLAVTAVDAFNGRIIADGIKMYIEKQIGGGFKRFPVKPVRNASGVQVFLNRRNQAPLGSPPPLPAPPYHIVIDAREAGYFSPPPTPIAALPNDRRLLVRLHRRPDSTLDAATTSISGLVVRGAARVGGALVKSVFTAGLPPNSPQPESFETFSDERGAFSLRMRLPASPVNVRFEISENGPPRILVRSLTEGVAYAFKTPIDLQGNNANNDPPIVVLVP